ncbi:MAG: hypothetical protein MI810_25415 [Flavobacteriales bacterium]|nr:hypothetical protein [Flavobacteriales bacterium]
MHSIQLNNGQELFITGLYQAQVGVMLEGHLHPLFIEQIEKRGIELAKELFNCKHPYLIPYPKSIGSSNPHGYDTQIMCVVHFESEAISENKITHKSSGVLIWFQKHYAFPIDKDILTNIQSISWEGIAIDFEL